jgi:hypothetical protein
VVSYTDRRVNRKNAKDKYRVLVEYRLQERLLRGTSYHSFVSAQLNAKTFFLANFARDLVTSEGQWRTNCMQKTTSSSQVTDNEARLTADPGSVFDCLVRFLELGKDIISFLLQCRLLLHLLGSGFTTAGPVSIILCFLPMILESASRDNIWSKGLFSCPHILRWLS